MPARWCAGFRLCRGRRSMRVGYGRAARPRGGGRAGGVRGTGETGLWGVSWVPRCLHLPAAGESGAVCVHCRAEHGALGTFLGHWRWFCLHFPRSFVRRAAPCCFAASSVIGAVGFCLQCGSGLVPPGVWYSRSRDGGSLTSVTSRLGVGVRSGKRRRHAASTSVQAAGGIEPEPQRAAPVHAGTALYGHCAARTTTLCETSREPQSLNRHSHGWPLPSCCRIWPCS